jgi:hypothetical protein
MRPSVSVVSIAFTLLAAACAGGDPSLGRSALGADEPSGAQASTKGGAGQPTITCSGPFATAVEVRTGASFTYSCYPYQCSATTGDCAVTCAANTDCVAGYFCNASKQCVLDSTVCVLLPSSPPGGQPGAFEQSAAGDLFSCGAYACDPKTNRCFDNAASADHCGLNGKLVPGPACLPL